MKCKYCNCETNLIEEINEVQTWRCPKCKRTHLSASPQKARYKLKSFIKQYGNQTVEEFEANNGIF